MAPSNQERKYLIAGRIHLLAALLHVQRGKIAPKGFTAQSTLGYEKGTIGVRKQIAQKGFMTATTLTAFVFPLMGRCPERVAPKHWGRETLS